MLVLSSICNILIRFISNPTAPTWWGFLVAGLMFVCSVMQTLISYTSITTAFL